MAVAEEEKRLSLGARLLCVIGDSPAAELISPPLSAPGGYQKGVTEPPLPDGESQWRQRQLRLAQRCAAGTHSRAEGALTTECQKPPLGSLETEASVRVFFEFSEADITLVPPYNLPILLASC